MCNDQEAVDLVREIENPFEASKLLVDHALSRFSTDNLSCMVVHFDQAAMAQRQNNRESAGGVEGDPAATQAQARQSEDEKTGIDAKESDNSNGGDSGSAGNGEACSASPPTSTPAPIESSPTAEATSSCSSNPTAVDAAAAEDDDGSKPSLESGTKEAVDGQSLDTT